MVRMVTGGKVSAAAVSDIGPKSVQQDSRFVSVSADGSWVIAVADGLSSPEGGEKASAAAVAGLPERISSAEGMARAFRRAYDRVAALYHGDTTGRMVNEWWAPATTLCVAAHTPESGTIAAWAGDSIPFVVAGFAARQVRSFPVGYPHVGLGGGLRSFLGPPVRREVFTARGSEDFTVEQVGMTEVSAPYAVVAVTDGVWVKALLGGRKTGELHELDTEDVFGEACAGSVNARDVAVSALRRAQMYGLSDNAAAAAVFIEE